MQATLLTNLLLPLALGVIMLGLGLGLTTEDFRRIARYPRAVLIGLTLQIMVLPWVAFGLALGFGLPPELPSLGQLSRQAQQNLQMPSLAFVTFFTFAIMLSLLVFIFEGVRDAFDPRKTYS